MVRENWSGEPGTVTQAEEVINAVGGINSRQAGQAMEEILDILDARDDRRHPDHRFYRDYGWDDVVHEALERAGVNERAQEEVLRAVGQRR